MEEVAQIWEYLDSGWVLAGLVLVVFSSLLKLLPVSNLDSTATERLMHKGVNYLFVIGLFAVILGFYVHTIQFKVNNDTNTDKAVNEFNTPEEKNLNNKMYL